MLCSCEESVLWSVSEPCQILSTLSICIATVDCTVSMVQIFGMLMERYSLDNNIENLGTQDSLKPKED